MTVKELEARIKTLEEVIQSQAIQIRTLRDIEEIKKLHKAYGYYLEHWMAKEIIDLFSDAPDVSLTLSPGTYVGKAGVRRYFNNTKPDDEFLHQLMQLSGIVDVAPDGNTAKGRWYGFGALSMPQGGGKVGQIFMSGLYDADYVKEDGVWKFKKLQFDMLYTAKPMVGWVKPEKLPAPDQRNAAHFVVPDLPRDYTSLYPSGHIMAFHFKHPVTGLKTSETEWNQSLKKKA